MQLKGCNYPFHFQADLLLLHLCYERSKIHTDTCLISSLVNVGRQLQLTIDCLKTIDKMFLMCKTSSSFANLSYFSLIP